MNEKDKNTSIENIIAQGLVKPQTVRSRIATMYHAVGLRHIFWDTGYSLFFAGISFAIVFVLYIIFPTNCHYSAAVAVAPLSCLLITAFAETSQRFCGLYQLKQTCRYTIRQITALRLLCYSIIGAVSTAVVAALGAGDAYEFSLLLTLCLSALFICVALSMTVMRVSRGKWASAVYSAAWIFLNLALMSMLGEKWEKILGSIPVMLSVAACVLGAVVLAYQISRMLSEVDKYAIA